MPNLKDANQVFYLATIIAMTITKTIEFANRNDIPNMVAKLTDASQSSDYNRLAKYYRGLLTGNSCNGNYNDYIRYLSQTSYANVGDGEY